MNLTGKGLRASNLRSIRRSDEDSPIILDDPRSRDMGSLLKVQDAEVISAFEAIFQGTGVMADKDKARLLVQIRDEIYSHWAAAKTSFVAIGKAILEAERTLAPQEFRRLVKAANQVFPFSEGMLTQLRTVAKAVASGAISESEMPGSYSVAYQMAVMDGPTIEIARARNLLRPDVTRNELVAFRREVSLSAPDHGVDLAAVRRKKARLVKLRDELQNRLADLNAEISKLEKVTT